ncbi:MAG: tetratricopeptide repeat protein [Deltaproteobacteria bacterium]|nr:tetratricopeptide repeat protein [Deltaproteobacteria bacterium]
MNNSSETSTTFDTAVFHRLAHSEFTYLALILFVHIAIWFNCYSFDLVWDDVPEITDNPLLEENIWHGLFVGQHRQMKQERAEWIKPVHDSYRPIRFVSYKLDLMAHKLSPQGLHIHNLILSILAIVIVFWAGGTLQIGRARLIVTALFAFHPVQVESIAYVSARGDLLSAIFALLSFTIYIHESKNLKRNYLLIALGMISFIASIASKESSLLLPIPVLLAMARYQKGKKLIIPGMSLIAAAIIWWFLRSKVVTSIGQDTITPTIKYAPNYYLTYVRTFFLPMDCSIARQTIKSAPIASLLVIAASYIALSFVTFKKKTVELQTIHLGVTFFATLLLPSLVVISVTGIAADRYMYLPIFGLAISSSVIGVRLFNIFKQLTPVLKWTIYTTLTAYGLALLWVSYNQTTTWRSSILLYSHATKQEPDSPFAWYGLGHSLMQTQGCEAAEPLFQKATTLSNAAISAWNNLGVCQLRRGAVQAALLSFQQAINESDGLHPAAWFNMGESHVLLGQTPDACVAYRNALRIKPDYVKAQNKIHSFCHPQKKVTHYE